MNKENIKKWLLKHKRKIAFTLGITLFIVTILLYFYENHKAVAITTSATSSTQTAPVSIVNPKPNAVPANDLSALSTNLKAKQIDDTSFVLFFLLASGALIVYSIISRKKERS